MLVSPQATVFGDTMRNITFSMADMHLYGPAFFDFLKLRKRFFVDQLGWNIPHDENVEMDQYDNPQAHYALVLDGDEVVGGARTLPTTAQWGSHTYMLRDAAQGKLNDIPEDVVMEDVVRGDLLECTRLVISDRLRTHAARSTCLSLIAEGLIDIGAEQGASRLICLSTTTLLRAVRRLGYEADQVGAPYVNCGDGRTYAVLSMSSRRRNPTAPHTTHHMSPQPVHAPSKV